MLDYWVQMQLLVEVENEQVETLSDCVFEELWQE